MTKPPRSPAEAAPRLAEALHTPDDLSCEEAEALLPALIDAERAGEDVERNPAYAALLRHLDYCPSCLALYEQLAEDLDAVAGEPEVLPSVAPPPPVFFAAPARKGDHVLLQVGRGLVRRFTLAFDLPRLAPSLATLGGSQRVLFSDTLTEVTGAPLLALTAGRGPEGVWLQVAVREPGTVATWRLRLELGKLALAATTDARGIARFTLPPDAALGEVRLHCAELPVGAEDE